MTAPTAADVAGSERAAVVAWLRKAERAMLDEAYEQRSQRKRQDRAVASTAYSIAAAAIERGVHAPQDAGEAR